MRKKVLFIAITMLIAVSGCKKDNDETVTQVTTQAGNEYATKNEEESTEVLQDTEYSEYSAEKADVILEKMGIKSYDIWTFLRPETGKETDEFISQKYAQYADMKGVVEELRNWNIHGRYKVEQEEPLIMKVNCKKKGVYMPEETYGESAFTYFSPNGFLVSEGTKWYEICGYGNYREAELKFTNDSWMYEMGDNGKANAAIDYHAYGFDKSDEKTYTEEKIMEIYIPDLNTGSEYEEGNRTYMCGDFNVNVYYRIYEDENMIICFYTMLDEYKAVTCCFKTWNRTEYNEITEEMLREMFTIREYK